MCRIMMVRSQSLFSPDRYLADFAEMCRTSKEYQGHGWGFSARTSEGWKVYKNLTPVWEDQLEGFDRCDYLVVHARSAFRNEGIEVENNMPFYQKSRFFIFNGELHGVKIRSEGRIGAEKIFNYIQRLDRGNLESAFRKATDIIRKRTSYVRAMNILMTEGDDILLSSHFGEDPDYFTMHYKPGKTTMVCSQPLGSGWHKVPNHTTMVI